MAAMNQPSPDHERERLAGLYSAMSDEELAQIATSGDELSPSAQTALREQARKRGLDLTIVPPGGEDVFEYNDTVTVRQFRDLPEALLAKGGLESAGIQAYLVDDNMIRMDWFISNLLGGIKLKVRPEEAEAAREILSQPIPEMFDVEGVGSVDQPKCPKCQALDVSHEELNKAVSFTAAYVGVPIPVYKKGWTCHACGHDWAEEGSELK
jgi:hypothetical protein